MGQDLASRASASPGMRRGDTQSSEGRAVRRVADIVEDDLGWIFRGAGLPDYGVDAQIEVVDADALVSGRLIGLQVKGGSSYFGEPSGGEGWTFRDSNHHLAYWLGHSLPVIVVLVDPNRRAFWQVISTKTATEHEQGFSVVIPRSQPLDGSAQEALLRLAGRREGLLELLPGYCDSLPASAVSPIQRAGAVDRLGAARLAERLCDGRDLPGMTAASLVAARPSWLAQSAAAQDLWSAVGAYADQHGFLAEAGSAFELAAQADGPRSARAWACAGQAATPIDRGTARAHLQRAREQGAVMIADIGLSMLEIPEGDAAPAVIPPSVGSADPETLDGEPYALNFLSEMATRRGEPDTAVRFAERAVAAVGPRDARLWLALARQIHLRALTGDMSRREFRRALGYAQAAADELRRWDGPSHQAVALIVDVHIAADEMTAAVTAALPASEGGKALDREAASPDVARLGAMASLASGNGHAYEFFMERVPDGPHRRELLTVEAQRHGQTDSELISARTSLLREAADDAMAARCIAALVKVGCWPPEADKMRARSVLPEDSYEILRAVYRARTEDFDLGLARLRELSARSAFAATELIDLLRQEDPPDRAIEEAERQVLRWPESGLIQRLMDLHGRSGHDEKAAELIEKHVSDESLAADVRHKLANWYVRRKTQEHQYSRATDLAIRGLAAGNDPELAWNLIKALYYDSKIPAAREALARYQPEPAGDEETHLWVELHLGVPLTPADAAIMAGIAERQPDGQFRDATIALLAREVLHTPPRPGESFSADVTETARRMEEQAERRSGSAARLGFDDDASLRAALRRFHADPAEFQGLIRDVQASRKSLSDIGLLAGHPYAIALLNRPAGILPAADLEAGLRQAGQTAARSAIQTGACVADLSSLYLLGLIAENDRLRIRSKLPDLIVARAAVMDAVLTRDQMRSLGISTYAVALRQDGTAERRALSPLQQTRLREQAETLETLTTSMEARSPALLRDAAADTVEVAAENTLSLWCDDIALRQRARAAGIPAFSLVDLVSELATRQNELDQAGIFRSLATEYVVDLPLTADDITAIATSTGWTRGPAHTALARPGWWRYQEAHWVIPWKQIAAAARRNSEAALIDISKAALIGALSYVSRSYQTMRYQELAVATLMACHGIGMTAPASLLSELAWDTPPGLAPRPKFVLQALTADLQSKSVEDAAETARELLNAALRPKLVDE